MTNGKFPIALRATLSAMTLCFSGCAVATESETITEREQMLIGGEESGSTEFHSTISFGGCTGVKVGTHLFLTAAHCVMNEDGSLGANYRPGARFSLTNDVVLDSTARYYSVKVVRTRVHPTWLDVCDNVLFSCKKAVLANSRPADVALIEVEDYTSRIVQATVDLNQLEWGDPLVKVGYGCDNISGFSRRRIKDSASAPPQSIGTHFSDFDLPGIEASYSATAGQLVSTDDASLCRGDSGGPLFRADSNLHRVVGINAFERSKDAQDRTQVDWHTRIDNHSRYNVGPWLKELGANVIGGGINEGTGSISFERWNGISGTSVSDIPTTTPPSLEGELFEFAAPENVGGNYGLRVRGYVTAPVSGEYRFFVSADESAALYLSTDESEVNSELIASLPSRSPKGVWELFPTQRSELVSLVGGQRYYIEALMKEGSNDDFLDVGWLKPGQTGYSPLQIIPGLQLSPFEGSSSSCTCPEGCDDIQNATVQFTKNGADQNCYFFSGSLGGYLNNWQLDHADLNGENVSNRYVSSSSYPAKVDGGYYLFISGHFSWSHLEVR